MKHAPSLKALKLMHLMIGTAAGRMADDVRHEIRLSELKDIEGMDNLTRTRIVPLFEELRAATLSRDDTVKMRVTIGGLLDEAVVDYRHEVSGDTLISWSFGRTFREMARDSNHWAILDRQAVFHLGSKYSVLLFQHIASLQNLKYVTSKQFTVSDLRLVLGVPDGKLSRFSSFKQWALEPAIAEINSDLTRLHLTATYHKIGRTVAEVEIAWEVKEDLGKVKAELVRPKVGRKARREGTEDKPVLVFPASGSIKGTKPWETLARENVTRIQGGRLPDLFALTKTFRKWCETKAIPLDNTGIDKTFVGFCKTYRPPM
jgi:hypothetical protein